MQKTILKPKRDWNDLPTFLVVHPYLDVYGGGEKVCHNIIKALAERGQKVELLTFDFDAERYAGIMGEEFPKGAIVHSLGKRIEAEPPFTIYKRRHNIVKLLKKFRKNLEYDYLFSTQSSSPFETVFLNKAKRNIAYVHFPEIHFDYEHSSVERKVYLWLFKKWVEEGVREMDLVLCNSEYTKAMIERYWERMGIQKPIVVYPPVDLDPFWCDKALAKRPKRVTYVGRFIPMKRHEIIKRLALELPEYEFVSIGGLVESDKTWFSSFSEKVPPNYMLKPNLPRRELIGTLQASQIYVHLMEGEHFGIAPIEALASGCITLVHNSGGSGEFVPEEFRWENYDGLKRKIAEFIGSEERSLSWDRRRPELWREISTLEPENFKKRIWDNVGKLME
ncbi:TPA: glycosyltransferase family 4 protein [Candidatus Bathyarchaeota archaeon]|nr:glycosyltransferase family 4 protein [Candidatus Bathyarchaeota archaeon]HIJ09075.1 glycosyltransferase family 4 protein [Candidatus Bathyarchaeota archaeon]